MGKPEKMPKYVRAPHGGVNYKCDQCNKEYEKISQDWRLEHGQWHERENKRIRKEAAAQLQRENKRENKRANKRENKRENRKEATARARAKHN